MNIKTLKSYLGLSGPIAKDSMIYSVGPLVTSVAGLLLVPILTRIFKPSDYGVVDTVIAFSGMLAGFFLLGLHTAAGRFYYDNENREYRSTVLSTGLLSSVGIGVLGSFFVIIFRGNISILILKNPTYHMLFLVGAFLVPLKIATDYTRIALMYQLQRGKNVFLFILPTILNLGLAIWFALKFGVIGVIFAAVLAYTLPALFGTIWGRNYYKWRISISHLQDMLKYGLPFSIVVIAVPLSFIIDRGLLAHFGTLKEVGLYSAGIKIAAIYGLLSAGFRQAWAPIIFSKWEREGFDLYFSKVVTHYCILGALLAMTLSMFSREIVRLFLSPEYSNTYQILAPLAISWILNDLFMLFGMGMYYQKRTYPSAGGYLLGIGLGAAFDILLIPFLGILGAAIGNTLGKLCGIPVIYVYSQRMRRIPYQWSRILTIFAFLIFAVFVSYRFESLYVRIPVFMLCAGPLFFGYWGK